jgi:membrane dipeptidase
MIAAIGVAVCREGVTAVYFDTGAVGTGMGNMQLTFSRLGRIAAVCVPLIALMRSVTPAAPASQSEQELTARARAIHERVITLDTHNDIDPSNFTRACNYTMNLTTQVNLPKMREGGLDVSFMIVYVGQSSPPQVADAFQPSGYDRAYTAAVEKFDAIHRLTKEIAPNDIELALTAADVTRIANSGKKVAVIGIENGYSIGTDIQRVKEFWDRGGRYMSLAHNGHSQLSDSNTGEANNQWLWGGLSPLGRQVIAEMNKWGMMVDVSHPSKGAMMQALGLSQAPVIASHSGVRKFANVSRNMDDEMLMAMKTNGGVVQLVAFSAYVKSGPPERGPAVNALRQEFGLGGGAGAPAAGRPRGAGAPATPACSVEGASPAPARGDVGAVAGVETLTPERRAEFERRLADIDRRWPAVGRATVSDFVDQIDYVVKLIGIEHVGISSDFDGGGGIDGWNNAAETFNVTLELVRRGYTEEQIGRIWGGNLLRVWSEVERVARDIQAGRR